MSYFPSCMNRSSIQCPAVNNQLSPMIEAVQVLPRKDNRTRNAFPSSPLLFTPLLAVKDITIYRDML